MPINGLKRYEIWCDICGKAFEPEGYLAVFVTREEAKEEIDADGVEWRRIGRRVFCSDACEERATEKSKTAGGER